MNGMRTWAAVGAFALILAGLSGCTGSPSAEAVTLTIGTDDHPGVPSADQIEYFAAQVDELSGGAITIDPVWHAAGNTDDWDQAIAKMVMDESLDMAVVPTRAWDTLGVTSLEPLSAPFLIQSDDAVADVIDALSTELMAGLSDAGVEGIALFPEGLRHPFGYEAPIIAAGAYQGVTMRTPTSNVAAAMFRALGASVVDEESDGTSQLGRESSFLLVEGGSAPATGNVVFFPKVNALVIGDQAAGRMSDAQRDIIDRAATATLAHAIKTQPTEAEAAKTFCAQGGTIVNADASEVDAMKAATAPVIDEIAAQGNNATVLESIREIAAKHPAVSPTPCEAAVIQGTGDQTVLDGTYRFTWTADGYHEQGVTDEGFIEENGGLWTWELADGSWIMDQSGPVTDHVVGKYWIDGATVRFKWPQDPPETYTWTVDAGGNLTLVAVDVPAGHDAAVTVTGQVWERVG